MNQANRAMCYALRHPGPGMAPTKYNVIQKLVRKTNGKKPSLGAIAEAARDFKIEKKKRGRKLGYKKTSKDEDKTILQTFHKLRPPGHTPSLLCFERRGERRERQRGRERDRGS